jgi:transcription elongation factor Elf1
MTNPNVTAPESDGRRKRGKRAAIFTSTPEVGAPELTCPRCDDRLAYKQTVFSGVKPIERWDYFDCHACGPYVYRQRTRTLRPAT